MAPVVVSNRWAVVIPSIRPDKLREFLQAWWPLFQRYKVHLVIIWDLDNLPPDLPLFPDSCGFTATQMTHKDVPDYIPQPKTDMIRSWGFYYIWKHGLADYVLTLDDDVTPVGDPFAAYQRQFEVGSVASEYLSVGSLTDSGLQMRGFPYSDRKTMEVAVQYGGWSGVLDYDAATQLAVPQPEREFHKVVMPVPLGAAATCCIMNCAFKVEYTPIMWQLTMLDGRYNRVGDIWSGLFIKRTLDALGKVMVINGRASVVHQRASNAYVSLEKEAPSAWLNDNLWQHLPSNRSTDMLAMYTVIVMAAVNFFAQHDKPYAERVEQDFRAWLKLFTA